MKKIETLETILESSFLDYSAFILQRRAIPDARDGMKYTARQILHAQKREKLDAAHPFKKSQKSVSAATSFSYVHGDTSCYEQIIRMGRPLVQRYFLESIKGNSGQPNASGSYSAPRYTEARLSELSSTIMNYLNEDVLDDRDWSPTYDEEGMFPTVFPSVGFYGLCNGSFGSIGVGLISSIPQFNLREMNDTICNLIDNPNAEVDLLPDFASGGILLNPATTRASLAKGEGKSALVRGHIRKGKDYLEVISLPYGVYTNTICLELDKALNHGKPPFTEFKDLSQKGVQIRIYSNSLDELEQWLYKNTSVQKHFTIKLIMLHNGKTPKLFSLKDAIMEHINHSKTVYRRHFEFELRQLKARQEILDGLIRAYSILDQVIECIKGSSGRASVIVNLRANFGFTENQAAAIADLRLHRLSNMDIQNLENELKQNLLEQTDLEAILNNPTKFNEELKEVYQNVAKVYGDDRKTEISNEDVWESSDGGKASKPFWLFNNGLNYAAAYNKDDEVFEGLPMDAAVYVEPEQSYLMITNTMRGFERLGKEITLGAMKFEDIIKLNKDEKVIAFIAKDLVTQCEFAEMETDEGDKYSLHTSFVLAASKRGKKLVSGKYNVRFIELQETTTSLPKMR